MGHTGIAVDRAERLVAIDNHDGAYYAWRDAGVRNRRLIHIDAHHDIAWRDPLAPIGIGNFLSQALIDDLVGEVFWVVPDPSWTTPSDRRALVKQVRRLLARYPGPRPSVSSDADAIRTTVLGKPLVVCQLAALPPIDEPVLLDIDTDYLVVAHVYYESDAHLELPWCWPEELVTRLRDRNLRADIVTIARSLEGGYTPLKWAYLADELAARLRESEPVRGFDVMRLGAMAAARRDSTAADAHFREAAALLPTSAGPSILRALHCLDTDRPLDARQLWAAAIRRDPACGGAFSNSGLAYFRERRFAEAEREHRRALLLNERDAYAHFGLGRLAAVGARFDEAEACLRQSIACDPTLVDAHRALGYTLARVGRLDDAIAAYDRSLALTFIGHRTVDAPITSATNADVLDRHHCSVHARVARLYVRKGDMRRAVMSYRLGLAGGDDDAVLRCRLAALYIREGSWMAAAQELARALLCAPRDLGHAGRRLWRYVRAVVDGRGHLPPVVPADLA
jgi:tetratricopeptide (TPR) repeat protein